MVRPPGFESVYELKLFKSHPTHTSNPIPHPQINPDPQEIHVDLLDAATNQWIAGDAVKVR